MKKIRVPHKKVVRVLVVNQKKQMLFVRKASTGLWHPPGGTILRGEQSMMAALRELKEETGLKRKRARLIHTEKVLTHTHRETTDCFSVKTKAKIVVKTDGKEIDAAVWLDLHDMKDYPLTDTAKMLMENICVLALFL